MTDRTQHVLDAIDGALVDDEFPDAMRRSPEPAERSPSVMAAAGSTVDPL